LTGLGYIVGQALALTRTVLAGHADAVGFGSLDDEYGLCALAFGLGHGIGTFLLRTDLGFAGCRDLVSRFFFGGSNFGSGFFAACGYVSGGGGGCLLLFLLGFDNR
jgi:hypothetical protein